MNLFHLIMLLSFFLCVSLRVRVVFIVCLSNHLPPFLSICWYAFALHVCNFRVFFFSVYPCLFSSTSIFIHLSVFFFYIHVCHFGLRVSCSVSVCMPVCLCLFLLSVCLFPTRLNHSRSPFSTYIVQVLGGPDSFAHLSFLFVSSRGKKCGNKVTPQWL